VTDSDSRRPVIKHNAIHSYNLWPAIIITTGTIIVIVVIIFLVFVVAIFFMKQVLCCNFWNGNISYKQKIKFHYAIEEHNTISKTPLNTVSTM